jgi:hypothetical protein
MRLEVTARGLAIALGLVLALEARAENLPPTRDDFFRELLSAEPTPQTPRFGMLEGSYAPNKLDLLKHLRAFAIAEKSDLRLVLAIGPNGPVRQYTLVAVVADGPKSFAMNGVMVSEGRIVGKGTTPIHAEAIAAFAYGLSQLEPLELVPNLSSALKDVDDPETIFDFLLTFWSNGVPMLYVADLQSESREQVGKVMTLVNRRLRALRTVYQAEPTRPPRKP